MIFLSKKLRRFRFLKTLISCFYNYRQMELNVSYRKRRTREFKPYKKYSSIKKKQKYSEMNSITIFAFDKHQQRTGHKTNWTNYKRKHSSDF